MTSLSLKVESHVQRLGEVAGGGGDPTRETLEAAAHRLLDDFDPENGGLGGAPKFPRSLELDFLFHYYHFSGEAPVLEKLGFTLEKMARGGIYDQLGGGFHRYSVDAAWVVPHFEKMLYDNALLPPLYLAHYRLTGSDLSRRIAAETLDFILREMRAPEGGFYAAWDADSEGVEGKYYVWSREEVAEVVGPEAADLVTAALGVTPAGNFEGANILTRPMSRDELAARFQLAPEQLAQTLAAAFDRLNQVRAQRVPPHRDEKVIVAWNGLAITALAQGAQVLGERRYYEAAARAARFLLADLVKENTLFRIWTAGQVSVPGFSEDYALLANALLDLYETDFDPVWVSEARRLMALMDEKFLDPGDGTYFYVDRDQATPLVRSKSIYDQVLPSGNSMAARVSLRLYRLTGEGRYQERAQAIIRQLQPHARENPWGFAHLWTVQTLALTPPLDLTLVGDPQDARTQALVQAAYRELLAGAPPGPEKPGGLRRAYRTPPLDQGLPPAGRGAGGLSLPGFYLPAGHHRPRGTGRETGRQIRVILGGGKMRRIRPICFVLLLIGIISTFTVTTFAGPPFLTDDPEPVPFKHWEFYLFSTVDATRKSTNGTGPAFEFNVGALPNLQVHLILPLGFTIPKGEPGAYGLGDMEFGLKYRFIQETDYRPMVGVFPQLEIPTGDANRGLGNGRAWGKLPL